MAKRKSLENSKTLFLKLINLSPSENSSYQTVETKIYSLQQKFTTESAFYKFIPMVGYGNNNIQFKLRICTCVRLVLLLKFLKLIIEFIAPVGKFITVTNSSRCLN